MFEHLVVFKFGSSFNPEQGQQLVQALLGLKDQIPGITALTAGVNVTEETENIHGYTLGLRVTFTDQEALRAYGPHPAHQQFVAMLEGIVESVVVVDYPVQA
ncbi:Dabb family protein [Paenibacillus typhae]|uniref:Stress responsive A/B Barrel Domain n=1 Tax=Paenibacillus typhae TaxID=1174501 RepID=A0A1G9B754_9BACL|nr:Dabb family protein [Paenibacillus typhae]SDK34914.1 Stress responsive A/B Barrel Domain [Paenibacillus typhae]